MSSSVSFSGAASGIDTDALIEATISSKRELKITPLKDKIAEAEDETSAMEELKEKFTDLKELLENFTTLKGGAVQKQAVSNDETVISATASSSASMGTYEITTTALAQQGVFTFDGHYTSSSDPVDSTLSGTKTITVTIGTGSSVKTKTVNITNTTTITDLCEEINSANIGCEAVKVNIGTTANPSYTIMISSTSTGITNGSIDVTTDCTSGKLADLINNGQKRQAQNAVFSVAGLASNISRETNDITDLLTGVTLNLQSTGTAIINVEYDMETTEANIQEIFDAVNEIINYISENNTVEREEDGEDVENIFAALSKTNVDNSAIQDFKNALSSTKYSGGTYIRIFADFGITTNTSDGTYDFDTEKFEEVFAKEPNSINKIITSFADTVSSTGGTIDVYTRYNGMFDLVINSNDEQITAWNERIARYESMLETEEENLRARYASFESLMSEMQSAQSALASLG